MKFEDCYAAGGEVEIQNLQAWMRISGTEQKITCYLPHYRGGFLSPTPYMHGIFRSGTMGQPFHKALFYGL